MVRILLAAGFGAVLAIAVLVGYAQISETSETRLEADRPTASGGVGPGRLRASKLLGSPVYDPGNTKIGDVKELIIGKNGRVSAVVVKVAFVGLGDKYVAVELSDFIVGKDRLILGRTRDQLQQMTGYKLENESHGAAVASPN